MTTTTANANPHHDTHEKVAKVFDRYWRVLSVLMPLLVVPAIQWGVGVNHDLENLRLQLRELSTRRTHEQQAAADLTAELRAMRGQLEQFRMDVVQRIAVLEARIDMTRPKETR